MISSRLFHRACVEFGEPDVFEGECTSCGTDPASRWYVCEVTDKGDVEHYLCAACILQSVIDVKSPVRHGRVPA